MGFRIAISSEKARTQMFANGKYLIASVEQTGQERNPKKVFDRHFRYKEYIKLSEWYADSIDNIWSLKYLGLDSTSGFKKLEYQNPAYCAGKSLNKDPRLFSNVFTVQLAGCDYKCLYCYVPYRINQNKHQQKGKYLSADEIVDSFLEIKKNSSLPLNVLRISGGNPTIVPEIIIELVEIVRRKKLADVYIWIDSNLSNSHYMKILGKDFISAIASPNVGIVGCFKGICSDDFEGLTGCSKVDYEEQFKTASFLLSSGCDFYIYLPSLTYLNNYEEPLKRFALRLFEINPSLPARVELLKITDYPASVINMEYWQRRSRMFPQVSQKRFHEYWYNCLLPELYKGKKYPLFCCEATFS